MKSREEIIIKELESRKKNKSRDRKKRMGRKRKTDEGAACTCTEEKTLQISMHHACIKKSVLQT
jgi:hypothetical protein